MEERLMKKFLIIAVAAMFCLAFTMPAMAKTTMGGMITLQTYYQDDSGERQSGGVVPGQAQVDDFSRTYFALPNPYNRFWVRYTSDDGVANGYIQLRWGDENRGDNFNFNYGWIDWHFNPSFYLRIGRQTQAFAITSPNHQLGSATHGSVLSRHGNIHGASSRDGVRAYIKFNDMVRMEIQALNPDNDDTHLNGNQVPRDASTGLAAANAVVENTIPRFDIAVPIKVANFKLEPSFTWLREEYDQVASGSDDDYDIWGLALGITAGFGPVEFKGEVTYGENLGSGTYVGAGDAPLRVGRPMGYIDTAGNTKIEDTEIFAWWAQLGIKFGPATLYGTVGNLNAENDGAPGTRDNRETDVSRWAYGVSLPIKVAKGFIISPQIWFLDYDDDATWGPTSTTQSVDYGDTLTIGVHWQLSF
jgi:hypothetical protein